jgi:hypothetical protein
METTGGHNLLKIISFIACMISSGAFGQLMMNDKGQVWTEDPFFNPVFIRQHQIKAITGRYTYKAPGQAMNEKDYFRGFQFDTLGRLVYSWETKRDDGSYDTTFHKYVYNNIGRLIYHGWGDKRTSYYESFMYQNGDLMTSSEIYLQYHNRKGELVTLLQKKQSYIYEVEGNDTIKITKNSFDFPYKKEWKVYNEKHQLIRIDERFIANNQGMTYSFDYYPEGLLERKSFQDSRESEPQQVFSFAYDDMGNIKEKKIWKNGKVEREQQFIFNSETGYLTAILEQQNENNFITIIRFRNYDFYTDVEESSDQ